MGVVPHASATITKRYTTVGYLPTTISIKEVAVKGVTIHTEGSSVKHKLDGTKELTDSDTAYITSDGHSFDIDGMWDPGAEIIKVRTPVALGEECIVNGGFSADTNWTKGAGWTIAAGKASHATDNGTAIAQTISTVEEGKQYLITVDVTTTVKGYISIQGGAAVVVNDLPRLELGTETLQYEFVANDNSALNFQSSDLWGGSIDNFSMKEVTPVNVSVVAWR